MSKILLEKATRKILSIAKIQPSKTSRLPYRALTAAGLIATLAGCAHTPPPAYDNLAAAQFRQAKADQQQAQDIVQTRKYYKVNITTHDNITLTATVYQPELRKNETAPLLLHSHGFSMYRMKTPLSFYSLWMFAGQTALDAWKAGYWVISYDQRGHGGSDGTINLLAPDKEIRDVSTIIDWAIANLPHLAMEAPSADTTTNDSVVPPGPAHPLPKRAPQPKNEPHLMHTGLATTSTNTRAALGTQHRPQDQKTQHQHTAPSNQPDPLVGMIGESYMGSTQLMAATVDERIDALVPLTTWFDLTDSLLPGEVAKSGWLTTLILSGNTLNPSSMNPELNYAYRQIRQGLVSEHFRNKLANRSFKAFCENYAAPGADALIMQGFRDSLFSFNHGVQARDCMRAAGHDVRLIGTQGGHLLPLSQLRGLKTVYSFDRTVHCGRKRINTKQMVIDWFDEKLRGKLGQADYIPELCVTLNEHQGVELDEFPIGGQTYGIDRVELKGSSGFWELALTPLDWLMATAIPRRARFETDDFINRQGGVRPAFVPLVPGSAQSYISGIPIIDVTLENLNEAVEKPTVFVGIGIKHSDSAKVESLSDQVMPLSGAGRHHKALSAVSAPLAPGDMLGLVVYGYSNQFRFSGSGFETHAAVSGQVQLPIQSTTPLLLTDIDPLPTANEAGRN